MIMPIIYHVQFQDEREEFGVDWGGGLFHVTMQTEPSVYQRHITL